MSVSAFDELITKFVGQKLTKMDTNMWNCLKLKSLFLSCIFHIKLKCKYIRRFEFNLQVFVRGKTDY